MGLATLSPGQLRELLDRRAAHVFDVNARASWSRARVPGATHLDPAGFREADLPADRDAALVFYCSNPLCLKAPNAARRARGMGFTNVRVLPAGISGWLAAGLPVESGEAAG